MNKIRIIAWILVLASICTVFFGCGSDEEKPTEKVMETNTETDYSVLLPEQKNYGDMEIGILTRLDNEVFVEENGIPDMVDQTVISRNLDVEEALGVILSPYKVAGDWDNRNIFMDAIRVDNNAGDGHYDVVFGFQYYIPSLIIEGLFTNLMELPDLNLSNPWWTSSLLDDLTINDQIYCAAGDLTLSQIQSLYVVFFNKYLITEFGMESPYDLVAENNWTFETMCEMGRQAWTENGDGVINQDDMFGVVMTDGGAIDACLAAFDQPTISKDENGELKLAIYCDKTISIVEALEETFYETDGFVSAYNNDFDGIFQNFNAQKNAFTSNRILFFPTGLKNSSNFANMEKDFGVAPIPKWDSDQESYHTTVGDSASLICVTSYSQKLESLGTVLEYLSYESFTEVIPAFYETSLRYRVLRDTDSFEMLNILKAGVVYDVGRIYSVTLSDINHWFRYLIIDYTTDVTSDWYDYKELYKTALANLKEFYDQ